MCTECYEWRTRHPSGKCSNCREKEQRPTESIIARFEAALYVPYPAEFSKTKIGCRNQKNAFDKPNASQVVRETCWKCPMYDWCLSWGIENDEQGIWGGLSRGERRTIRNGRLTRTDVNPGSLIPATALLLTSPRQCTSHPLRTPQPPAGGFFAFRGLPADTVGAAPLRWGRLMVAPKLHPRS